MTTHQRQFPSQIDPNPTGRSSKEKGYDAIKYKPYHKEEAKGSFGLRNAKKGIIHIIDLRNRHGKVWLPKGQQTGNTRPPVEPTHHSNHTKPAKHSVHA